MRDSLYQAFVITLAIVALMLSLIAMRESIFQVSEKREATRTKVIDQNISRNERNTSTKKSEKSSTVRKLETTILEVKRSPSISKLSIATEIEDFINSKKFQKERNESIKISACPVKAKQLKRVKKIDKKHPILAIIMDDIGTKEQVEKLLALEMKITPSIFPSTQKHLHTPEYAKRFPCYMVHTPMEAYHFKRVEENTLKVSDSKREIEEKIEAIKKDFPKLAAINNHTGSKFTSDAKAMDNLFCALDKFGIFFVDSRTSVDTKARAISKLHHRDLLERDTFLDNEPDVRYIKSQILKSVKRAKRKGLSIAICHPREETFEALREAKKEGLFRGVKLVYIDSLLQ